MSNFLDLNPSTELSKVEPRNSFVSSPFFFDFLRFFASSSKLKIIGGGVLGGMVVNVGGGVLLEVDGTLDEVIDGIFDGVKDVDLNEGYL